MRTKIKRSLVGPAQRKYLQAIRDLYNEKGYWPSYREIQARAGVKSNAPVQAAINTLVDQGYVRVIPGIARGIRLIDDAGCDAELAQTAKEFIEAISDRPSEAAAIGLAFARRFENLLEDVA